MTILLAASADPPSLSGGENARFRGTPVTVPDDAFERESNDSTPFPFCFTDVRYQQVFDSTIFSGLLESGAYLIDISFRPKCFLNNDGGTQVSNLVVHMSTTQRKADALSSHFDENVGSDEIQVVRPRAVYVGSGGQSNCPNEKGFSDVLRLDRPFFYRPLAGNLLIDIRTSDGVRYDPPARQLGVRDAVTLSNDGTSRVYASPNSATEATTRDTTGLATVFTFVPPPSLVTEVTATGVRISWFRYPEVFRLQVATTPSNLSGWRNYTNAIGETGISRFVDLDFRRLKSAEFFRLYWAEGSPSP